MNKDEIQSYLNIITTNLGSYTLSESDKKQINRDLANFIIDKINRKKFRRKLTITTKEKILQKINNSIREQKPIHFVIPFGGYKHYWNESYPEPDWAEFFHLAWMAQYLTPILATYKPGAIIEYISEDLILNRMNNYPTNSLDSYTEKFKELINWFNKKIPNNLEYRYFRIGDKYDKDEIIRRVEALLPERREAFAKLPEDKQTEELHRSSRSIMWDGDKNLTQLTDTEKHKRIIESRLIELAYYEIEAQSDFLGDYLWTDDHICICFSFGLSNDNTSEDLTLASAEGSIVDFWIGRGILQYKNDTYHPQIVSQKQYQSLSTKPKSIDISFDDIDLKNLKKIDVIS